MEMKKPKPFKTVLPYRPLSLPRCNHCADLMYVAEDYGVDNVRRQHNLRLECIGCHRSVSWWDD